MNTQKIPEPATPAIEIALLTEAEIMAEIRELQRSFSDADYDALESQLHLRAAVLGWTGDPLKQPARSVLAAARTVAKGGVE